MLVSASLLTVLSGCGGAGQSQSVEVDASNSYCKQDLVVGNVDFVVTVRNLGTEAANISINPVRYYDDGSRNGSAVDTRFDIDVPAGGDKEVFNSYDVDAGHMISECAVRINAGAEISIEVRP